MADAAATPGPSPLSSPRSPAPRSSSATATAGGPTAWLRSLLRGAQAVAEERPNTVPGAEDDDADDAASDDGSGALQDSFGGLPEHLLEKVFGHLRGANRRHHFAICGVNRQWRRLGRQMFFSRPWEVAHLICHPTQLFCLSPRNVTGSRSGLLKCFVRREHGGPAGRRFTFHIGKDASQPQRSRFLMAAKQGGRDEVHIFLNSRCQGPPCARLRCNMFATQYKLTLAQDLQLEPTLSSTSTSSQAGTAAAAAAEAGPSSSGRRPDYHRMSSWGAGEAAEAVAAAAAAQRRQQQQRRLAGSAAACGRQQQQQQGLGVDCFAELQYQARVKGFMQPRRMRVALPHPSLVFYDQQLPQLHRRGSEPLSGLAPALPAAPAGPAASSPSAGGSEAEPSAIKRGSTYSGGEPAAAAAAGASSSGSMGGSPEGSPSELAGLGAAHAPAAASGGALQDTAVGAHAETSRLSRLLARLRLRPRPLPHLLRQPKTVPVGEALQPVILQNKAPHWNEGLRCWCLNFRGRVKLASVKNFQLVRADDPTERVVMQFGKAEQDAFILDFNPTVITAFQAFAIAATTFDSKFLL